MKKILVLAIILVTANIFLARSTDYNLNFWSSPDTIKTAKPEKYMSTEDQLINTILTRYHYRKYQLNDSLSNVIFNRYLKSLDYNRMYFLQSDIDNFKKYRFQLDDDIKDGDIKPAYVIFNIFRKRMTNRIEYAKILLNKGFDFTKDEKFKLDRKDSPWAKDSTEYNDLWRKRVKNDALSLMLTGKKWDGVKKTLTKRYDTLIRNLDQYSDEDVFQLFENSYTEALDPHTNYMSPITSDNFKIDMSRSLEGIGAQLQTEDEYTKIVKVIPGGPAFKSKLFHPGDRIISVGQGKKGEMVDVVGWRITDVVQLIRGPKGSIVRLQILPASEGINAKPKTITLVRDKIKLEEQSAKDKIINIKGNKGGYKIGVITIPAFYSDFEAEQRGDKNYKSTTRDVKKLLTQLKKENIKGLIIDLRNNGGGSLEEAVKLTGLFIKDGPVVQIKRSNGMIREEDDNDTTIFYNGPMAVLVNRFSASASEIFSAAIQDYGRGFIIGEQTYGKGTVQNLIDLNRLIPSAKHKLGQIKLTIAKFYRVNGESTQHMGVIPDITYPSAIDPKEFGESSQSSSLPWDTIAPTQYTVYGHIKKYIPQLEKDHLKRINNNDTEWAKYLDEVNEYKEAHAMKYVSLNEATRKKQQEEMDKQKFERENAIRKKLGLKLLKEGETKADTSNDKTDPLLDETGHILVDYINLIG